MKKSPLLCYQQDLEREVQELRLRVAEIGGGAHQSNERMPDAGTSRWPDVRFKIRSSAAACRACANF